MASFSGRRFSPKYTVLLVGFMLSSLAVVQLVIWGQDPLYSFLRAHGGIKPRSRKIEYDESRPNHEHKTPSMTTEASDRHARICRRNNRTGRIGEVPKVMKHMSKVVVLDELKLMFCYVPKVACTNWKRILLILQGDVDVSRRLDHEEIHKEADESLWRLSELGQTEIEKALNYTKIMFVRDPFARVLSAYRDKLEKPGKFRNRWRSRIPRNAHPSGENGITFKDFARYLANPANRLNEPDEEHWRTIDSLCKPCFIKYDFVGRFENLEEDTKFVLKEMLHSNQTLGLMNSTNFTNSSDVGSLHRYYSQLAPQTMMGLYRRYQLDFELFGYPTPQNLTQGMVQAGSSNAVLETEPDQDIP